MTLQGVGGLPVGGNLLDVIGAALDGSLSGLDEALFLLQVITLAAEDSGIITTRLGNDAAAISNIENVNASGNFYKFFDEFTPDNTSSAYVGVGNDGNFDEQYPQVLSFTFFVEDGDGAQFAVTVDVQATDGSLTAIRAALQAEFDAIPELAGKLIVPGPDDEDAYISDDVLPTIVHDPALGPTDDLGATASGPIVLAEALQGSGVSFYDDPQLNAPQEVFVRNQLLVIEDLDRPVSDLFFGDNRDYSEEEVEYRVPGLSPGVTAQMVLVGSDAGSGVGVIDGVQVGTLGEDGGNILIAGYDNDFVAGLSGDDLLMGGDLEFLLTHRHNPNLYNTSTDTVSVNGADGLADDGRDTLVGGAGSDHLVWEADGGLYAGDADSSAGGSNSWHDTLWVTLFSSGRRSGEDGVRQSTDGSQEQFLAIDGAGTIADQDLIGDSSAEAADEGNAILDLTTDNTYRFDLGGRRGHELCRQWRRCLHRRSQWRRPCGHRGPDQLRERLRRLDDHRYRELQRFGSRRDRLSVGGHSGE